jgi:hypothetical protein
MRSTTKQPSDDSSAFVQLNLVHENLGELLRSLVNALGGPKKVGARLQPQKDEDSARRYLLDCLNPDRPQDIGAEGLFTLLRWGREKGEHFAINWICDQLGYTRPSPIEPEDQRAELQRQFLSGVERLEQLARRLGK